MDYVKLDGCYSLPLDMDQGYPDFGRHLNRTGRQMVYSCSWPVYQIYAGISVIETAKVFTGFTVCFKWNFNSSQTFHQSSSIVICGETMTTFKIHGHRLKQSLITTAITKMPLYRMLVPDIGTTLTWYFCISFLLIQLFINDFFNSITSS